jgi:hypothetical protein
LVIAVDVNPSQQVIKKNPNSLTKIVDSVCAFANSHLMLKPQNKIAVVACNHQTTKFIYPTNDKTEIRQIDGQHELFLFIERSIKTNLAEIIQDSVIAQGNSESFLAACLAMCLCYITRVSYELFQNILKLTSLYPFLDKEKSTTRNKSKYKNSCYFWK